MRSLRIWLLLPLVFLATSYVWAGDGEAIVSDSVVHAYLESLNLTPGMTQAEVIKRLGFPSYTYKADYVTSYPVFERDGRLFTRDPGPPTVTFQLMLKFSAAWRLASVTLIQRPYRFFGERPTDVWLESKQDRNFSHLS